MKIAIVGAGAIGGYLGAKLSLAGEEVTFIARNNNLAAINAAGMALVWEDGREERAGAVKAVQHMHEAGPQDAVFITLKAHQLRSVLPDLRALFGPHTPVVTMLNGVPWWYFQRLGGPYAGRSLDSVDPNGWIAQHIEAERVIGAVVYPAAELIAPGVVKVIEGNRFTLGELDGTRSERIEELAQMMMRAGFKCPISKDIRSDLWVKLWGNLSFNPISALTQATLHDICTYPATRELVARMMGEAQTIGEKLGAEFKVSIDKRIAGAQSVGAHKTSMLQDIEQGRVLELEALVGAVIELGRITDTPTPTIQAIYATCSLLSHTLQNQHGKLAIQPLR